MTRHVKLLGCLLLCGLGAWAQQEAPKIVVNVGGFRYPPIARSARIQGDVIFQVGTTDVDLIIGNLLLASAAQVNLQTWDLPPFKGDYLVRYHFNLTGPGTKRQVEPIGDRVDRFFRRLFRAPIKRVIEVCDDASHTRVRQTVTREGGDYVIDVAVTDMSRCTNTEVSTLAGGF
jgi:hypothetical protein